MMTAATLAIELHDIAQMIVKTDHTDIFTLNPQKCTCGRMVCAFVNRNGRTLCVACDQERMR